MNFRTKSLDFVGKNERGSLHLDWRRIINDWFRMSVEQWVSDELHAIVGISDRTICQYVLALARKSSSTEDFIGRLKDNDALEINDGVRGFAAQLMQKLPRSGT